MSFTSIPGLGPPALFLALGMALVVADSAAAQYAFAPLSPAGSSTLTVTVETSGQTASATFSGTAGQRVFLQSANGNMGYVWVEYLNPDGNRFTWGWLGNSGYFDTTTLSTTATYTITVDPQGTTTGSVTLTLYDVPSNAVGTITPGGSPVTVAASMGQNPTLTFSGTAGQRIMLETMDGSTGWWGYVGIYTQSGTQLGGTWTGVSAFRDGVITLPATDTYSVVMNPDALVTGSIAIKLYEVPADVSGTIAIGGQNETVATTAVGQNGMLTVNGTAGQRLMIQTMNGTAGWWGHVGLYNQSGTHLGGMWTGPGAFLDTVITLTTTDTYTLKVDPNAKGTGSLTVKLHSVPADMTGSITPGGQPVTVTTTIGQNGLVTFTATAGQRVLLQLSNPTSGWWGYARIYNPGLTTWIAGSWTGGSGVFDTMTLGMTGTYTIAVDPNAMTIGSLTLTLYDVPPDLTGDISAGLWKHVTTAVGQNASLTFTGTVGQTVAFKFSQGTYPNWLSVSILKPDNSLLTSTSVGSTGTVTTPALPVNGTYTVKLNPSGADVGTIVIGRPANAECVTAISPGTSEWGAAGGLGWFGIQSGAACNWTLSSTEPWLVPLSANGTGAATAMFSVAPNSTLIARTATLTVDGQSWLLTQDAGAAVQATAEEFLVFPKQNQPIQGQPYQVDPTPLREACLNPHSWPTGWNRATMFGNSVQYWEAWTNDAEVAQCFDNLRASGKKLVIEMGSLKPHCQTAQACWSAVSGTLSRLSSLNPPLMLLAIDEPITTGHPDYPDQDADFSYAVAVTIDFIAIARAAENFPNIGIMLHEAYPHLSPATLVQYYTQVNGGAINRTGLGIQFASVDWDWNAPGGFVADISAMRDIAHTNGFGLSLLYWNARPHSTTWENGLMQQGFTLQNNGFRPDIYAVLNFVNQPDQNIPEATPGTFTRSVRNFANTFLAQPTGFGLQPGEVLHPGETRTAADGRFRLIYQGDGNLVLYFAGTALWHTGTVGTSPGVVTMQSDGDLVVRDETGTPRWASGTSGHPGAYLVVQSDGNLVIYHDTPIGSTPKWASNTAWY